MTISASFFSIVALAWRVSRAAALNPLAPVAAPAVFPEALAGNSNFCEVLFTQSS